MQLLLTAKNHNSLRWFPFAGYLGQSKVVVEGVIATRRDADSKPLPAKSITVSVRCYEFRLGRIGGVVSNRVVVDMTQVLWSKPDGQDFAELGEAEYPFRITLPARVGGFSTVSFVEYRCVWRVEAVVNHAHISGIGSRLVKHCDIPLVRYDVPSHLPSPRSSLHITNSHLDRQIRKPRLPTIRYCVNVPREPIGPTDLLPVSIYVLPKESNVSIRSATVVIERRIQFIESNSPASGSSTPMTSSFLSNTPSHVPSPLIPIPKSPSVSSLPYTSSSTFREPQTQSSLPSTTSFAATQGSDHYLSSPSAVSLASDTRPLLPPSKHRSDSSESLVSKPIVLPIVGSESSGPFSRAESGIWSKTLTVQWPSAKPSSRWGIGETIQSDLVSIRFFARVKIIVTSPYSTDSLELDEEEIFVTSINEAERRLALSKSHGSTSEGRSKSKSPRRTRRKRENTPVETRAPAPSTPVSAPGLKPPYKPASTGKSIRRPHTSAGPRDKSSLPSPSSFAHEKAHGHTSLQIPTSSSSSSSSQASYSAEDSLLNSKKRPSTASSMSASSTLLTRSNVLGQVYSPIIAPSPSSGSSTLGSTTAVSISDLSMSSPKEDSVREWEEELARIELRSRRSSDLLGFGLKRKRPPGVITCGTS